MIAWWIWLIVVLGAMIFGVAIASAFFLGYSKYQDWKLKRKLPGHGKDHTAISEYLEQENVKKVMLNGGKPKPTDIKEVEEYERTQSRKFREYDKLKRFAQTEGNGSTQPSSTSVSTERGELPVFDDARDNRPKRRYDDPLQLD